MNDKLFAHMQWRTDEAVSALRAETLAAAARLARRKRRRRETQLFALALCAAALGMGAWALLAGGPAQAACALLKVAGILAGATLALSPLLAYFMEGERRICVRR